METKSLSQLCAELLEAKKIEKQSTDARVEIERQIVAITGVRTEGSKTHDAEGFKVTVTGKLTRKMNWEAWETIKGEMVISPFLAVVRSRVG